VDFIGSISRSAQSLKEPPSEERVPTFTQVWWVRSIAVSGIFKGPSGSKGRLGSKGLTRIWPRDREPPGVYSHPRTKIQVFLCAGIVDELGEGPSQPCGSSEVDSSNRTLISGVSLENCSEQRDNGY
jgi:hypothetical protein